MNKKIYYLLNWSHIIDKSLRNLALGLVASADRIYEFNVRDFRDFTL